MKFYDLNLIELKERQDIEYDLNLIPQWLKKENIEDPDEPEDPNEPEDPKDPEPTVFKLFTEVYLDNVLQGPEAETLGRAVLQSYNNPNVGNYGSTIIGSVNLVYTTIPINEIINIEINMANTVKLDKVEIIINGTLFTYTSQFIQITMPNHDVKVTIYISPT